MKKKWMPVSCVVLWLSAVVAGWSGMTRFNRTPGAQGEAPRELTASMLPAGLLGEGRLPSVLVALHPQCSCSIATMHELRHALEQSGVAANVVLLVFTPERLPEGWTQGEALLAAAEPLHARVIRDPNGRWAAGLGARTSGQVLLYAPQGRLLFQGGITDQRGHEGTSLAAGVFEKALREQRKASGVPGVFGCSLFSSGKRS